MLRAKAITTILVAMLLLPAKSVAAQNYVYFDEDQSWFQFWTPPAYYSNFPERGYYWLWGDYVSLNQPPGISWKLKWRVSSASPEVSAWVHEAVQEWDALLPPWIYWQEMMPDQALNLSISEGTCIVPALGCFWITSWGVSTTKGYNAWYTGAVRINYSFSSIPMSQAAKELVVKHEFGHVVGLHERYPAGGGCNPNEVSVMESVFNVAGTAQPCDGTVAPRPTDAARITTYYRTGQYPRDSINPNDNTWIVNGKFYSRWDDYAAVEDNMNMDMQWSNSLAGPWTTFASGLSQRHVVNIGSHGMTGVDLYIEVARDLNQFGAPHGKYIRVCAFPEFGWENGVGPVRGTTTCSSTEWWP